MKTELELPLLSSSAQQEIVEYCDDREADSTFKWQAPLYLEEHYVHREEEKKLLEWGESAAEQSSLSTFVIYGPEGTGKKTLAAFFFEKASHPIRIWFRGSTIQEIEEQCKELWIEMHPRDTNLKVGDYLSRIRNWLDKASTFLIVFENGIPEKDYFYPKYKGQILILSACALRGANPTMQVENLRLRSLNNQLALPIVQKLLPSDASASLLVQTLGKSLPRLLGVIHILSYLRISIQDFVKEFSARSGKLALYQTLCDFLEEKAPIDFKFLQICAYLNRKDIPIKELEMWKPEYRELSQRFFVFFKKREGKWILSKQGMHSIQFKTIDSQGILDELYTFFSRFEFYFQKLKPHIQTFLIHAKRDWFASNPQKYVWLCQKFEALTPTHLPQFFKEIQSGNEDAVRLFLKGGIDVNCKKANGDTPLSFSIRFQQKAIFSQLIERGADVDRFLPSTGKTPLMCSVQNEDLFYAKELIKAGAKLDLQTEKGETALYFAAQSGNLSAVKLLLSFHADSTLGVKEILQKFIPLTVASMENHTDCVLELLNPSALEEENFYSLFLAVKNNKIDLAERMILLGADVNKLYYVGKTPLMCAAQQGNVPMIQFLIEKGATITLSLSHSDVLDFYAFNDDHALGHSPLIYAAESGSVESLQLLLKHGAALNAVTASGRSALYTACKHNRLECARILIQRGALTYEQKNSPLLFLAIANKNKDLALLLIDSGEDVNAPTPQKKTPLMRAAELGDESMVQFLIDQGAHCDTPEEWGPPALFYASARGNEESVLCLLNNGANFELKNPSYSPLISCARHGYEKAVQFMVEKGANVNVTVKNYGNPLLMAALNGHESTALYLIEHGADAHTIINHKTPMLGAAQHGLLNLANKLLTLKAPFDTPQSDGSTPIMLAAQYNRAEMVELLINQGVKPNSLTREKKSPLHFAVMGGGDRAISVLLKHGADREATFWGHTPLHLAAQNGHLNATLALLDSGAQIDAKSKAAQRTPLLLAANAGHVEVVRLLIDRGADIHAQSARSYIHSNVFELAVVDGHLKVVNLLIEKGINPKKISPNALHWAVTYGLTEIAERLLDYGYPLDALDENKSTYLMIAVRRNHLEMVKMLLNRGADIYAIDMSNNTALDYAYTDEVKSYLKNLGVPSGPSSCTLL